ncbi:hypothetical protein B0J12DRAFT_456767 [Macrophomina phaseolina]|uniref:Transferase n=1 Tax=Macrophomina phaseolina TaxID=35725 RepID=A0ABQ8GFY0_9PEZI|nr:hypothetical protein B0J12DRAFT_456767 [Macrophomina phaseolina]
MSTQTTTLASTTFQWAETIPGRWERKLDEREHQVLVYTRSAPKYAPYYGCCSVKFKYDVEDIIERVRQAWRTLRHDHPSLGASVEDTENGPVWVYRVPSEAGAAAWLAETFSVDHSGRSADELYPYHDTSKPIFLKYLPATQEVVFGADHVYCDGIGILLFLNNVCELVARPRSVVFGTGAEVANLSLPFASVLDIPEPSPDALAKASAIIKAWAAKAANSMAVSSSKDSTQPPGTCRKLTMLLSQADTSNLQQAAKAKGMTLAVAAHAAVIMATKRHGGPSTDGKNWASSLVFGYRHKARPPYNSAKFPISVLSVGFPEAIENPTGFLDAAEKLRAAYTFWLSSEDAIQLIEPLRNMVSQAMKKAPGSGRMALPNVVNIGVIKDVQERYGDLEVLHLTGGMREIGPSVDNHFLSFRGRLNILSNFNDAYHDVASIERLMQMVKEELFRGLDVQPVEH